MLGARQQASLCWSRGSITGHRTHDCEAVGDSCLRQHRSLFAWGEPQVDSVLVFSYSNMIGSLLRMSIMDQWNVESVKYERQSKWWNEKTGIQIAHWQSWSWPCWLIPKGMSWFSCGLFMVSQVGYLYWGVAANGWGWTGSSTPWKSRTETKPRDHRVLPCSSVSLPLANLLESTPLCQSGNFDSKRQVVIHRCRTAALWKQELIKPPTLGMIQHFGKEQLCWMH